MVSYENYAVGAEVKTDMGSAVKSVTDYNFAMQFKKDNTNVAVVTYVTIICGIIVLIDEPCAISISRVCELIHMFDFVVTPLTVPRRPPLLLCHCCRPTPNRFRPPSLARTRLLIPPSVYVIWVDTFLRASDMHIDIR